MESVDFTNLIFFYSYTSLNVCYQGFILKFVGFFFHFVLLHMESLYEREAS